MTISLSVYKIRVRRYKRDEIELDQLVIPQLSAPEDKPDFLLNIFKSFFENKEIFHDDYISKSTLKIKESHFDKEERLISGILDYGKYGISAKITNIKNEVDQFERKEHHTESIPLYYLIYTPELTKTAYLIVEEYSGFSCKVLLMEKINTFLKSKNAHLSLEANIFIRKQDVHKFFHEDKIGEIIFIGKKLKRNLEDMVQTTGPSLDYGHIEVHLKAGRNKKIFITDKILQFLGQDECKENGWLELDNGNEFPYESVKVRTKARKGKSPKMHPLSKLLEKRATLDITNRKDLELFDNHPEYDSINTIAKTYLTDIIKEDLP